MGTFFSSPDFMTCTPEVSVRQGMLIGFHIQTLTMKWGVVHAVVRCRKTNDTGTH